MDDFFKKKKKKKKKKIENQHNITHVPANNISEWLYWAFDVFNSSIGRLKRFCFVLVGTFAETCHHPSIPGSITALLIKRVRMLTDCGMLLCVFFFFIMQLAMLHLAEMKLMVLASGGRILYDYHHAIMGMAIYCDDQP